MSRCGWGIGKGLYVGEWQVRSDLPRFRGPFIVLGYLFEKGRG